MDTDDEAPLLEYAPVRPRALKRSLVLSLAVVSLAGAGIVAGGKLYRGQQVGRVVACGAMPASNVRWAPASAPSEGEEPEKADGYDDASDSVSGE